MLLPIWTLLSFVYLASRAAVGAAENSPTLIYNCDEEIMQSSLQKLAELEAANEDLHHKIDNLNINLNQGYQNSGNFSNIPSSCAEAVRLSGVPNGIHKIRVPGSKLKPFYVYCVADPKQDGGAWTLVQRRLDGSIDFQKPWHDYVRGFGNSEGEFFIGLQRLHELTQSSLHELWIQLVDFENVTRWAKYRSFAIGDASEDFALNVLGSYAGDAGDALTLHAGAKFSTKDVDNDDLETANCAVSFTGAWWYKKCLNSNLNGQYQSGSSDELAKGINWYIWRGPTYSMKYVHMAIRSLN